MKRTRANKIVEFGDQREDDEVFIVEKVLRRNKNQHLVQCVGYEPEWMESIHIPSFLLEHFHKTGKCDIPVPQIQSSSTTGNIVYQTLTWTPNDSLPTWTPPPSAHTQSLFPGHSSDQADHTDHGNEGPLTCNTKKDKDSRFHRHTAGIFIGLVK